MLIKVALNKLFPQAKKIDKELFESIKKEGISTPIVLYRYKGHHTIMDGTQRVLIAKLLKYKDIVANVFDIQCVKEIDTINMIHKTKAVKVSDQAYKDAFNRILARGMSIPELAEKLNKPVSWIKEKLK